MYITKELKIELDPQEITKLHKFLNMCNFNDENCNIYNQKTGRLEAKYPEKETPEILESYYNANRSQSFMFKIGYNKTGRIVDINRI